MNKSVVVDCSRWVDQKDLSEDIRGWKDLHCLLREERIIVNMQETSGISILKKIGEIIAGMTNSLKETDIVSKLATTTASGETQLLNRVRPTGDEHNVYTTWCEIEELPCRMVVLVTLTNSLNEWNDARIIAVVAVPPNQKQSKSGVETAKSFASLLAHGQICNKLLKCSTSKTVLGVIEEASQNFALQRTEVKTEEETRFPWYPGRGIFNDFRKVVHYYKSDYTDSFIDARSLQKTISTTIFLLFTVLPTATAYGMLNEENTAGTVNVSKVILGQTIGGIFFGLLGGQQLLIMTTSAPLSIYIDVIYNISKNNGWNFWAVYASVGIWCQIFLMIYAIFEASLIMKYSKRSTEEIFSLFIATTFIYKALHAIVQIYSTNIRSCVSVDACDSSAVLLFILMVSFTYLIASYLNSFQTSQLFTETFRDFATDYALPIAVIFVAIVAQTGFHDVKQETFKTSNGTPDVLFISFWQLPWQGHAIAFALAFPLSVLFFMDQLLVTNTVDNKQNGLRKGSSHNWDFVVVAVLNAGLSIFGLPWMHGGLPQSFLHLKALADVEEKEEHGNRTQVIVNVRETRVAVLAAHLLIAVIYLFLLPYSKHVPIALFYGLFVFMAISSLTGNHFWERIRLLFTEQRFYPNTEYLKKVTQRTVHYFTFFQLLQLLLLLSVGFASSHFVRMTFPLVIFMFIPIRNFLLPRLFSNYDLEAIDSVH